jgi:LysR family glycine cleavage system transcriptional activator
MAGSDLPPLAALRAFEATARLSSFKAAAAELFVTPTAISHQIRQLEEYLGVRVLDRSPRNVSLTSKGRELYEATVSGFSEIRQSVIRLREIQNSRALTLSATTAFLSHWLVPRLGEIRRVLPELDLRLHASETIVRLQPGEIDVAIRYGKGPFTGVETTPLKADAFTPLCSPGLNIADLEDIRRVALIHVDGRTAPLPLPDWPRWCAEAGISGVNTAAGLRFSNSMHAMQAAIAGQGVAIVSLVMAADALASGLLIQPFNHILPGDTYHFACAPGIGSHTDVDALRRWFQTELEAM